MDKKIIVSKKDRDNLMKKQKILLMLNILILITCGVIFYMMYKRNMYDIIYTKPVIMHTIMTLVFISIAVVYGLQLSYFLTGKEMLAENNIFQKVNYRIHNDTATVNTVLTSAAIVVLPVVGWMLTKM